MRLALARHAQRMRMRKHGSMNLSMTLKERNYLQREIIRVAALTGKTPEPIYTERAK